MDDPDGPDYAYEDMGGGFYDDDGLYGAAGDDDFVPSHLEGADEEGAVAASEAETVPVPKLDADGENGVASATAAERRRDDAERSFEVGLLLSTSAYTVELCT